MAKFCSVDVSCGEDMNTQELLPHLTKNLKELLPDHTQFRVVLWSNMRGGADASIWVRFNDQDTWAQWVGHGFNEEDDRSMAGMEKYWEENGSALFAGITQADRQKQPGWACNRRHGPYGWETPNHYFRNSEFDYERCKGGSWYNGSSDIEGFLKEMKFKMSRMERNRRDDPEPFGDLDLETVQKELQ